MAACWTRSRGTGLCRYVYSTDREDTIRATERDKDRRSRRARKHEGDRLSEEDGVRIKEKERHMDEWEAGGMAAHTYARYTLILRSSHTLAAYVFIGHIHTCARARAHTYTGRGTYKRKRERERDIQRERGRNGPSERRYDKREVFRRAYSQSCSMVVAAMFHAAAVAVVIAAVGRLTS